MTTGPESSYYAAGVIPGQPASYGPPLLAFCSNCGKNLEGFRFCRGCGTSASGAPAPFSRAPFGGAPFSVVHERAFQLRIRDLVPLRSWLRSDAWRRGWLGIFLACAVTPFVLLQATGHDQDVRHAAWGFSIYFAVIWLIAMRALIRPEPISAARLAMVVGVTALIGVSVAITIERHLAADTNTLFKSIVTVGFPEELVKALPLLLVWLTVRAQLSPKTYLYLGAVSGLTFGVVESVAYTALYSDGINQTGDSSFVTGIIWRLLTDSLFHAAMAGIVGVFIGFAVIMKRNQVALVGGGLTFAAVLHGTYDRTAGHWGGVLVAVVVMFLFVSYVRSSDEIVRTAGRGGLR